MPLSRRVWLTKNNLRKGAVCHDDLPLIGSKFLLHQVVQVADLLANLVNQQNNQLELGLDAGALRGDRAIAAVTQFSQLMKYLGGAVPVRILHQCAQRILGCDNPVEELIARIQSLLLWGGAGSAEILSHCVIV